MSTPLVGLEQATLGYNSAAILSRLDLRIEAGDFVVVEGPNGGGKTTLLKSLSGLIPLLSGTRDLAGARIGYAPQQATFQCPLPITAWELVELGASAVRPWFRTLWRMERQFYEQCLEQVNAIPFAHRKLTELSGGQRQRVLLARALAMRPNLLLLDEPTAGVDVATQSAIASLIGNLNKAEQVTVVIVTHEPVPFALLATRLLHVANGVIMENPPIAHILQ